MLGEDGSRIYPWLEVTKDGEVICLNEFSARLAISKSNHVIQMDDHQ